MPKQKPREIAVRVLSRREKGLSYLEDLLKVELLEAPISGEDRALIQELTYGIVRWQAPLDWLIDRKTQGRTQKSTLRILLRLGLYQLFWLNRIPDHAAVFETVELAKRLGFRAQAGFINALLRGYLREQTETRQLLEQLKIDRPALGYSHPEWLCQRWQARWAIAQLICLLEWNNSPPPTYARVNTLKIDALQLAALWDNEGVKFRPMTWNWIPNDLVFQLEAHPPLSKLPSFERGFFYIQDPSTLLAVHELDPRPGDRVLDLCAAPGGKSTFAAQYMKNQGKILALDVSPERLELLRQNSERLGVTCVDTALLSNLNPPAGALYDRILIDAPCSNTGVMRRRVDLRWRIRPEEIERLSAAQIEILERTAPHLKPGGKLVYSTCSLEPEENSGIVKKFLGEHPEVELETERELFPFIDAVDGAYVACLKSKV